ncbi:hypothetical protein HYU13_03935 [Candidatus Woesearchaeota archaeon]|nr:hypothetical protein [Candidatus Woesearchaeota archaeon]
MRDIFVIVHQKDVHFLAKAGLEKAIESSKEIARIKMEEEFRLIEGDPNVISADLPAPEDCGVFVCGSCVAVCLGIQRDALSRNGYHQNFLHLPGSIYSTCH